MSHTSSSSGSSGSRTRLQLVARLALTTLAATAGFATIATAPGSSAAYQDIDWIAPPQAMVQTRQTFSEIELGTIASVNYGITTDGRLLSWGDNSRYQRGVAADQILRLVDVSTRSALAGKTIRQVSADGTSTVILDSEGNAFGIGTNGVNSMLQIAGKMIPSYRSVTPEPALNAGQLSGRKFQSICDSTYAGRFAIDLAGALWYWGPNSYGVSGTGSSTPIPVASQVSSPKQPDLIDCSINSALYPTVNGVDRSNFAMFLGIDGSVSTVGSNDRGQLGIAGSLSDPVFTPTRIEVPASQAVVAGATFGLALTLDYELWTWGDNSRGQLGQGNIGGFSTEPSRVSTGPLVNKRIAQIAVGDQSDTVVIRTDDGDLYSWGAARNGNFGTGASSMLGTGSTVDTGIPSRIQLPGGKAAIDVSCGTTHCGALDGDGFFYVWGFDGYRGFGTGNEGTSSTSRPIAGAY